MQLELQDNPDDLLQFKIEAAIIFQTCLLLYVISTVVGDPK